MTDDPPMRLKPRPWKWPAPRLAEGWLNECSPDFPIVWQALLTDDAAISSDFISLLSAEERARLERLKQPDDRQRFLIGRGLLRMLVGAQLSLPPERVEFQHGPFGKPFVVPRAGQRPLHFNVSHSGKLILLAFHRAREVGVDVEEMRDNFDCKAVAERIFRASKYRDWTLISPQERSLAFFREWTRHEAALKALGLGFSDESKAQNETCLTCFDLKMPAGYQGAVACLR